MHVIQTSPCLLQNLCFIITSESAESAWDSMLTVSNAGRKRGRASRGKLLKKVNLSVGQKKGHGKW